MHISLLADQIGDWLIEESLGRPDIVRMFEALCLRLSGIGVPVSRGWIGWSTLHPLFSAESALWTRDKDMTIARFPHGSSSDAWSRSPLAHMETTGLFVLRRPLAGSGAVVDYPLLTELAEAGYTDWLALRTDFATHSGSDDPNGSGIFVSWATDRPGGFRDEDIAGLQGVQQRLAAACKMAVADRIVQNIANTYIGRRAGQRVLAGSIHLGDSEAIEAVVWYSDLRESTRLSESMSGADYLALLNTYFQVVGQPAVKAGGEILAFIGDAVLVVFPLTGADRLDVIGRVVGALDEALDRAAALNAERIRGNLMPLKFGIGLNIGEVMFGNIGVPERLAFTVVGPTVIEVARIEKLNKETGVRILANRDVAELAPGRWRSLGPFRLEGIAAPMEIFAFREGAEAKAA